MRLVPRLTGGVTTENDAVVTPSSCPRRTPLLRGLAAAAVLLVALGASAPARAAAPAADFEQLIARADEHASAGRHADALRTYVEAFEAMPRDLRRSSVGEFVVLAAANAAEQDYQARSDRASLEAAVEVLHAFMGEVKAADPEGAAALVEQAKLRSLQLGELLDASAEPSEPAAQPEAGPADEAAAAPQADDARASDRAAPDRRRVGLALAVTGGVAVLGGVGLMIAGVRQVPWYEGKLADEGWVSTDVGYGQQIADAERIRNLDLGLGAGVVVIGLGLGITGAVLVAKRARGEREVTVVPVLGRDRALLAATLRF